MIATTMFNVLGKTGFARGSVIISRVNVYIITRVQ
jgi:hypothetical protein